MAHAPYVAQWLLKRGALRLFDDKSLLLTNFLFIFIFYLTSTDIFRWKTEHQRAWRPFFIFCSPPTLSVENKTSEGIGARREATVPCPSLWPCNKVLKPNFQSIISQTNNGSFTYFSQASDFRHKLRKYFCCTHCLYLSIVTALTARFFSIKKVC